MASLDLDDLPPKIATLLAGLVEGEELLLVQYGAVVGKLTAQPCLPAQSDSTLSPDQHVREVLENFRASIEDEF